MTAETPIVEISVRVEYSDGWYSITSDDVPGLATQAKDPADIEAQVVDAAATLGIRPIAITTMEGIQEAHEARRREALEHLAASTPPGTYDAYYREKEDERFGDDIAAATRAIANTPKELDLIRTRLLDQVTGWVEIEVDLKTKYALVRGAEDAGITVDQYLRHALVAYEAHQVRLAEAQAQADDRDPA